MSSSEPVGGDRLGQVHSAAEWRLRRDDILRRMQLVMGPFPDDSRRTPLAPEVLGEEVVGTVVRRRIAFCAEPGDRVPAYLLLPRGLTGRAPAMLCLHQTTRIGKGEPAGLGGRDDLHYALELAERGYVTLAPDYPGYGDYSFDSYAHGYVSATMKGIWNHVRAVDFLTALPEVDGARVGCIGHSLGGHNTMFVGAFDTRLRALVSSCGFNSFLRYCGGDLTGWSHAGYMPRIATAYDRDARKMPFDFTEVLSAAAPRAVFVNAPLEDDNFDVRGVRDCEEAAAPVYELLGARDRLTVTYPKAGHAFPKDVRDAAYAFVDKVLSYVGPQGR